MHPRHIESPCQSPAAEGHASATCWVYYYHDVHQQSINSFIPDISIALLQVHNYKRRSHYRSDTVSELTRRSATDTTFRTQIIDPTTQPPGPPRTARISI